MRLITEKDLFAYSREVRRILRIGFGEHRQTIHLLGLSGEYPFAYVAIGLIAGNPDVVSSDIVWDDQDICRHAFGSLPADEKLPHERIMEFWGMAPISERLKIPAFFTLKPARLRFWNDIMAKWDAWRIAADILGRAFYGLAGLYDA